MQLSNWLRAQGLERLKGPLLQAGVDLDILFDLDDADLEKIGLSFGDRIRLLKAILASPQTASEPEIIATAAVTVGTAAQSGERRQLTVMLCDLVGSTALSSRLDRKTCRRFS